MRLVAFSILVWWLLIFSLELMDGNLDSRSGRVGTAVDWLFFVSKLRLIRLLVFLELVKCVPILSLIELRVPNKLGTLRIFSTLAESLSFLTFGSYESLFLLSDVIVS